MRPFVAFVLALALAPLAPLHAGWASLGKVVPPAKEEHGLRFENDQGVLSVSAVSDEIVRVRFSPVKPFGRNHSYALAGARFPAAKVATEVSAARSILRTASLTVTIGHQPLRIGFADAAGGSVDEDDPEMGIAFSGATTRVYKRLRDDEQVYGMGEKTGPLNKRGIQLGGASYAMWNSDTYGYNESTDPIYASVPFFMVVRRGRAHGIFLDNTYRSSFDFGRQYRGLLSFGAQGGELNYYFIDGPAPRQVVERFTALVGRAPLPPLWSLGYHQCRYSYYPESKVRLIADTFREKRIPADTIWLDIHYLDQYAPFTWDKQRFPDPGRMIAELKGKGFRVVPIVDPHPKKEPGTHVYDSGIAGGHFVKKADGSLYEAPVWPSQGERTPAPSVFPDYSAPATREWWGSLFKPLVDLGVAGIWNDMNEPAVFQGPTWTFPLEVRHNNEGEPSDHRRIHNVYGMLMTQGTREGLLRLRPTERPFVLTRASFAGGQRYAAIWPGDNTSDWTTLRSSIPLLLNLGLSGFGFAGTDIGGFAEVPSAELFTRWLQLGVFHPFMRTHTTFGTPDQEPWSYGTRHEAVNRRAIELRYELLPHLYTVIHEMSETGIPAMRPLFLEYPDDPETYALEDEFLVGADLLVAPVLREAALERSVYLPKGEWYDFWSGAKFEGGRRIAVAVTLESIPIFVRGGAFVFRQPVVQHTGEMAGQPLRMSVFPAARSTGVLYEDDGLSLDHSRGVFARRRFEQRRNGPRVEIVVSRPEGSYRPPARSLEMRVYSSPEPKRVTIGGSAVPQVSLEALAKPEAKGWARDPGGALVVRAKDSIEGWTLVIE